MNKKVSLLLALTLALTALCGLSLAQDAGQADIVGNEFTGSLEDGGYVLRIPLTGKADEWQPEAPETGAVRLTSVREEDGALVVRYDAFEDGTKTVSLAHFAGIACDRLHLLDLKVEDGKITEITGGSFTAAPSDEELAPELSGDWLEAKTQFSVLTLTQNEQGGFDAVVVSPLTHGAFVLKATVYYDCLTDSLIYDNGSLYEVPITAEENPDLGEPEATGLSGSFTLIPANENEFGLKWVSEIPEQEVLFVR